MTIEGFNEQERGLRSVDGSTEVTTDEIEALAADLGVEAGTEGEEPMLEDM